jgi:hypothetical protein
MQEWRVQGVPPPFGTAASRSRGRLRSDGLSSDVYVLALDGGAEGREIRRLVGIKRRDLRQLGAGRADCEAR